MTSRSIDLNRVKQIISAWRRKVGCTYVRHIILLQDIALAVIVAALATAIYFTHFGADAALNSDAVMPYVLFDDLVVHGGRFASWVFPEAPFWLPDQLLIWITYSIVHNLFYAILIYAIIQTTLYLLVARWILLLLHASFGRTAWLLWLLIWLLSSSVGLTTENGWYQYFHSYIFLPNIHGGTCLTVLLGLALLLNGRHYADRRTLFALGLLCVGMLISDRLFALQFILPALLVTRLPGDARWRRWRMQVALLLGALLLLSEIARPLWHTNFLGIHATDGTLLWLGSGTPLRVLHDFIQLAAIDPVSTVYELIALGALSWCCVRAWHRRPMMTSSIVQQNLVMFCVFAVAAILLPLIAVIVVGRHVGLSDFRYEQTLVLSSLALAVVVAPRVIALLQQRSANVIIAVTLACVGVCAITIDTDMARMHAWHTPKFACLRQAQQKYQLRFGLAQYWNAMSAMAQVPGLVIAPLIPAVKPHAYLNLNLDWFAARNDSPATDFDFVDEGGLDPALMDEIFGTEYVRLVCPESALRIYSADVGILSRLYRHEPWLADRRLILAGRTNIPAAVWITTSAQKRGDTAVINGHYAVPTEVLAGVAYRTSLPLNGWITNGLPTRFTAGTAFDPAASKHVWIDYRSSSQGADVLHWKVVALDKSDHIIRVLGTGDLPDSGKADRRQLLRYDLLPDGTDALGISLQAVGDIDAVVYAVGWGRLH